MTQGLNPTLKGVTISDSVIQTALANMPNTGFDKAQFADALADAGLTEARDGDLMRRLMQYLKRQGVIEFDTDASHWALTSLGQMRVPHQTLPLLPASLQAVPMLPSLGPSIVDHIAGLVRISLSHLACFGIIAALITLNASFAWELGGERGIFQIALVAALIALDLMRPFLIASGLWFWDHGKILHAVLAVIITLTLSPVSVLSTTSILSASLLLGAELNTNAATIEETRVALQAEHSRLLDRALREEKDWQLECARGGCGPLAAKMEAQFQATITDAKDILNRILALSEASQGNSKLLARMVTTFEGLGLFGGNRQILLPLLLALSLELGALFGPALLLHRRNP